MTQEPRRMLAPWTVEEGDSTYLVRTANGFVASVTYWDDEPYSQATGCPVPLEPAIQGALNVISDFLKSHGQA